MAWDGCYIIFCQLLLIHSGKKRRFVFILTVQYMMSRIRVGSHIVFLCLYITPSHFHHCANLSENIELIKCMSDIFCRVCKIKHILSVIHYTIYGTVCFEFIHFPCDDWDNIYVYIYIYFVLLSSSSNRKYELVIHCLGLGHKTMVCAECLSIFLWAYDMEMVCEVAYNFLGQLGED